MRALRLVLIAAVLAAPAAGCNKNPPADQNVATDNAAATPADVEALPPDESSGTSSNELANGVDNSDVNSLNSSGNAY